MAIFRRALDFSLLDGYTYTLPANNRSALRYAVEDRVKELFPKQLSYVVSSSDTTNNIFKIPFSHLAKAMQKFPGNVQRRNQRALTSLHAEHDQNILRHLNQDFASGITHTAQFTTMATGFRCTHHYTFAKHYKIALVSNNIFNRDIFTSLKIESPRTVAIQLWGI